MPSRTVEHVHAAPWLARLVEHVPVARAGADPEGVHQVRGASGRLDVWLRMGERRALRDDLHWLRAAASEVRDFDVMLERALPPLLTGWIERERDAARVGLLRVFDSQRFAALLRALPLLPSVDSELALSYVKRERRKVEECGRTVEREDAGVADMHKLRRAARRLRYGREALGFGAKRVKKLQDRLGVLNDVAVALAQVDRCPHAAELADFRAQLGDEVRRAFEDAQTAWREADLDRDED